MRVLGWAERERESASISARPRRMVSLTSFFQPGDAVPAPVPAASDVVVIIITDHHAASPPALARRPGVSNSSTRSSSSSASSSTRASGPPTPFVPVEPPVFEERAGEVGSDAGEGGDEVGEEGMIEPTRAGETSPFGLGAAARGVALRRRRQMVPRRAIRDLEVSLPIKRIPCCVRNKDPRQPVWPGDRSRGERTSSTESLAFSTSPAAA